MAESAGLRLSVVTTFEALLALEMDWRALENECGADLPFQTWEWTVAWWQHLREHRASLRDTLRICVVRDSTDYIVAIAPLVLTERPSVGPFRVRYVQCVGADPNITEIRTGLYRSEFADECRALLQTYFDQRSYEWDWITIDGIAPQRAFISPLNGYGFSKSAYVLELASDWETMRSGLGRNLKESLRKCYNSLRRDGLNFRLETVSDPAEVTAALPDFFRLHTERASLASGPRHGDVFASPQSRAFLEDVCERLGRRNVTRVFRLRVDGEIVAVRIGFRLGNSLYLYYSGWKTEYGKYSVMTTLLAEVIKTAIGRGVGTINLSTGNDVSKTRWRPKEVVYATNIELSQGKAARLRYMAYHALRCVATGRLTRELLPEFATRRSEPRATLNLTQLTRLLHNPAQRLHVLAPAATALVVLDLLDGSLDHKLSVLAHVLTWFGS